MTNPSGSVPEKPESDRTRRRAFLIGGALLVAFAAIALGLSKCDPGPTSPEGRPDPGPQGNEPPGLAPAPAPAAAAATPASSPHESSASVPAPRSPVTRVVAVVEAPAGSGSRFVVSRVTLVPDYDAKLGPSRSLGMERVDGTWERTVEAPGSYALLLHYTWDGDPKSLLEPFNVKGTTGPEVRILLSPKVAPGEADEPRRVRWTVTVLDEGGEAIPGAAVFARVRRGSGADASWRGEPAGWTSDARGEAVLEVRAGDARLTVSREGFGTVHHETRLDSGGRSTVVLPRATARLRLRVVQTEGAQEVLQVNLFARTRTNESWYATGTRGVVSLGTIDHALVASWEHLVIVTGRGLAPVAVRLPPFAPDALEKVVDLSVDGGEDVDVRGVDGVDLPARILAMIEYEGPLGETMAHGAEVRKTEGVVRIHHVAAEAGKVRLRVGDRDYRGVLPAAGDRPRVVELR